MDTSTTVREQVIGTLSYLKNYVGPTLTGLITDDLNTTSLLSLARTLSALDSELRLAHQQVWQAAQEVDHVLYGDRASVEPMSVAPLCSTHDGDVVPAASIDHTPFDE